MIKNLIILAAGSGTRLQRPDKPKILIHANKKSLGERLVQQAIKNKIENIYFVTGKDHQKIKNEMEKSFPGKNLYFLKNHNWQKGMINSALQGILKLNEPFVLVHGDQILDDSLWEQLIKTPLSPEKVNLLVSQSNPQTETACLKIEKDRVIQVKKSGQTDTESNFNASSPDFLAAYPELIIPCLQQHQEIDQDIFTVVSPEKIKPVYCQDCTWLDIDTPQDFVKAESLLRNKDRITKVKHKSSVDFKHEKFEFIAGKPVTTDILVGRGLFKDPPLDKLVPLESTSSPIFIFTDETVAPLYTVGLAQKMKDAGYNVHTMVMKDGEESKSLENYTELTHKILDLGVDERSVFISSGGGVVCNVCGFIASTVYRGLDLVHLPTSLMSQCDAAISHKQAINGEKGKNRVGSYYSPRLVAIDVETLLTLDHRLIVDGFSEVIKHALGQEKSYIEMLLDYKGNFIRDLDLLEEVVKRNARLKCFLSKDDAKELREAMVLQYGHTVGHPIEYLSGYELYHGESVAIGMIIAAHAAYIMGILKKEVVDLHLELIKKFKLPFCVPDNINTDDIIDALKLNKRYLKEGTRMALLSEPGKMWSVEDNYVIPVPLDVLRESINRTRS